MRPASFLVLLCYGQLRGQGRVEVGRLAPSFELKALGGGSVSLVQLRGRPVLINFWASWCAPCRTEMPDLILTHRAHLAEGLAVVAVNLTDQERMKDVRQFVADLGIPFPVLLDDRGRVRDRYRLAAVPTSVFVDRIGIIRVIHPGPISRQAIDRAVATILAPH